jgi:hypothetical protein
LPDEHLSLNNLTKPAPQISALPLEAGIGHAMHHHEQIPRRAIGLRTGEAMAGDAQGHAFFNTSGDGDESREMLGVTTKLR